MVIQDIALTVTMRDCMSNLNLNKKNLPVGFLGYPSNKKYAPSVA